MIPILDLDDTLYPESAFVESGFCAVADMLEASFGWDKKTTLSSMLDILAESGRGVVFDELLRTKGALSKKLIHRCLQTYRRHPPRICVYPEARQFLEIFRGRPVYLVTDGNKYVQASKVRALGIEPYFKKVFITHRYGVRNAKPSVYCFELIRRQERCEWTNMMYIGDDPAKDFVNLNRLGVITVRVLTGKHCRVVAKPGYDAKIRVRDLGKVLPIMRRLK